MNKILSIIIPTYNMERYLQRCLNSLIIPIENMQYLEVLVVNDGSKDTSSKIAHEYEKRFPKTFRVIDKENGNYGSCINRGLEESKGKYIKVLDADDYFDNKVLNMFVNFIHPLDVDLVISDFRVVDEKDNPRQDYRFGDMGSDIFHLDEMPSAMVENLWHHGITYNKKVFNSLNYKQTEGISYTDDEWIFEPMVNVMDVICFPHILYMYLRGREGQTFDPKVIGRTLGQKRIVVNKMINYYEHNIISKHSANQIFLTFKLTSRIGDLYRSHLITSYNKESLQQIINFDISLKEMSPTIYKEMEHFKNRLGWRSIHQWRIMNYSGCAPAILLTRIKTLIYRMFNMEW